MSTTLKPANEEEKSANLWRQVRLLVRPWRGLLMVVATCVLGAAVAGIVPPLVIRHVVNANLAAHHSSGLLTAGIIYLTAVAAGAGLAYAYSYVAAIIAQRAIVSIRMRLFSHLCQLPVAYLDRTPVGDTISRATSDVETIDTLFTDGITTLVGQIVSLVVIVIAMVAVSPLLSAISVVVVPPLVVASRWLQVRVRRAERATRLAIGELNTQLSETIGGGETIRIFDRQEAFVVRFRRALHRTLVAQESSVRYNAFFTPVTALLSSLTIAVLLWIGARGIFGAAGVNLGTLTAFILLFQGFFAPIVSLGDQWNAVQAALAGAERVFSVLNLPIEPGPSIEGRQHDLSGLTIDRVSFEYQVGIPVLRDVSLRVDPGERVAIVGRTGSGKSTLLALAVGFYEPTMGSVLIAGRHPRGIPESEIRQTIGVVPQQVQLFSATLRDNITLGDLTIDDHAVRRTLLLVGLDQLVEDMPQGLDTQLAGSGGGKGLQLSTGQRQLVALARALVTEPKVLLLDEATATIDARSESSFRAALNRSAWARGCATVIVAHRISTTRDANRVLVMESGRIVEAGSPAELIKAGGHFAALAALDEAGWNWEGNVSETIKSASVSGLHISVDESED